MRLGELKFEAQLPQVLYKNDDRISATFEGQYGALAEITTQASAQLKGSLGFKFSIPGLFAAATSGERTRLPDTVTYKLDTLAKALVLDAQLNRKGLVRTPRDNPREGDLVLADGAACFSREAAPEFTGFSRGDIHEGWCLAEPDERLRALELERRKQEQLSGGREHWLLLLQEKDSGRVDAASILDARWFDRNTKTSYLVAHQNTRAFGFYEKTVGETVLLSSMLVLLSPA